ncbi:hypothetical protein [Actinomycetospora flava]|uniref:Uncharacterized protein n=1 Tax=Actinomycetospora flava TaxID=3129232 RepID=A0ABU8M6U0_9PSEU
MSVLGWVLVGATIWVVVSVAVAVVLARLVRGNRHTTGEVLRAQRGPEGAEPADLPAPRDGEHDRATEHRRN